MSKVLEFLIKLNSDAKSLVAETTIVSQRLDRIGAQATSLGHKLRDAFSLGSLGSSLMAIPGVSFLLNPYTLVSAGVGAIARLGAEAELTSTAFNVLVGNEEKAGVVLREITQYAQESPFDKLGLTENAKQMLAFGVETDKVITYLRQLGDISGGQKDKLDSLALVMGQVTSAGKLSGQDNLQFINAGFNPLKELQKMHPEKTYEELQKAMSKGAITSQHVAEAIQHATQEGGQFFEMSQKQSDTLSGRFASLVDNIQEMAVGLYQRIQPILKEAISFMADMIPIVASRLSVVFDWIVRGVEVLRRAIQFVREWKSELLLMGSIIGMLTLLVQAKTIAMTIYYGLVQGVIAVTNAWTAVQTVLNAVLTANPIGLIIVAVGALIAVIVYCWNKFAGFRAFLITMWDTMKQFGSIIKDYIVSRLKEMLEGLGKIAGALMKLFKGDFSGAWNTFKDGVGNLMGKDSATKAIKSSQEIVHNIKGEWQKNLKNEQAKDAESSRSSSAIKTPTSKGSGAWTAIGSGTDSKAKKGHGKGTKTGEALATGGSRPTQITISIGKLIETMKVMMMEKTDTAELEKLVLQALNRSLAIAQSTDA